MSISETAAVVVRRAIDDFENEANRIGILRSVEATEVSRWLREAARMLRESCDPEETVTEEPNKATNHGELVASVVKAIRGRQHTNPTTMFGSAYNAGAEAAIEEIERLTRRRSHDEEMRDERELATLRTLVAGIPSVRKLLNHLERKQSAIPHCGWGASCNTVEKRATVLFETVSGKRKSKKLDRSRL